MVAPVRETCAQTLGVALRHMNETGVSMTVDVLLKLLKEDQWEVRHGGLLGIKYALAVRQVPPVLCVCVYMMSCEISTAGFYSVFDRHMVMNINCVGAGRGVWSGSICCPCGAMSLQTQFSLNSWLYICTNLHLSVPPCLRT